MIFLQERTKGDLRLETDNAERVRGRKADKRERQSNTREKMWEIWKSSGASQHLDRQLSAVEKAQDKVFITRKMVRTLVFGEGSSQGIYVRVCAV